MPRFRPRLTSSGSVDLREAEPDGTRRYQREGIDFLMSGDHRFLADEPGLGKTLQLARASKGDTLVLASATILDSGTWDDEIAKWTGEPERFTQQSYHSLNARAGERPAKAVKAGERKFNYTMRPELDRHWDTLILDEAHMLKNPKTNWVKSVRTLADQSDRVFLATGTPISGWPHELFVLLQLLYPEESKPGQRLGAKWRWIESWFTTHASRFNPHDRVVTKLLACNPRCSLRAPTDPCDHMREFAGENLGDRWLQRFRDDVLSDLPPLTGPQMIECRMDAVQDGVYRSMRDTMVADLPNGEELIAWTPGARFGVLTALCSGANLVEGATGALSEHSSKMDRLRYDLENRSRPTLVLAHHRRTVAACVEVAESLGARVATLHGGTSRPARRAAVQGFQANQTDVLVGSIETVAEGLTLTAADVVILVEQSFKPSKNQQAIRRIHRMGQTRPCTAYEYVATTARGGETVDGKKRKLLAEKTDMQVAMLTAAQWRALLS
jgi:hypothetical protein